MKPLTGIGAPKQRETGWNVEMHNKTRHPSFHFAAAIRIPHLLRFIGTGLLAAASHSGTGTDRGFVPSSEAASQQQIWFKSINQ